MIPLDAEAGQVLDELRAVLDGEQLRALDWHFARWLAHRAGGASLAQLLAAVLVSRRLGEGHVCLELPALAGSAPFEGLEAVRAPALASWREALRQWPVVGRPGERAPLILDEADRLYLERYWRFEHRLAVGIAERAARWAPGVDRARLSAGLDRLFGPAPSDGPIDWQRLAAALAVLRDFCVISGGPGTGKTRTVTAILALLIEQAEAQGAPPPRIALVAPTGKAAARLTESIQNAKRDLGLAEALAKAIPEEAQTLHRLLGLHPDRVQPRHHADNPLHLDLLLLDEASMLDLPLAARLIEALPPACRLILLGDRDQLASVEAGMVLGDICGRGREPRYSPELRAALAEVAGIRLDESTPSKTDALGLEQGPSASGQGGCADSIALLRRSYRFREGSGIARLARAINGGDARAVGGALGRTYKDARHLDLGEAQLPDFIADFVVERHRAVLSAPDPESALKALGRYRVLGALREGPVGVERLNRLAEQALARAGVLRPEGPLYAGRPLLVTRNDYGLGLFNGDVGLLLPDPEAGGELRAWFETSAGVRRLLPYRLPPVETLFAMTVHKSQGSEFDAVALILPRQAHPLVTRELIYTGITRARRELVLVGSALEIARAARHSIRRSSGLEDALWPRPT